MKKTFLALLVVIGTLTGCVGGTGGLPASGTVVLEDGTIITVTPPPKPPVAIPAPEAPADPVK